MVFIWHIVYNIQRDFEIAKPVTVRVWVNFDVTSLLKMTPDCSVFYFCDSCLYFASTIVVMRYRPVYFLMVADYNTFLYVKCFFISLQSLLRSYLEHVLHFQGL